MYFLYTPVFISPPSTNHLFLSKKSFLFISYTFLCQIRRSCPHVPFVHAGIRFSSSSNCLLLNKIINKNLMLRYLVFKDLLYYMVEPSGIEPLTSCVQGRRSPSWAKAPFWNRNIVVGLNGLEPSTSRLSGVRSNQLSYRPIFLL